MPTRAAASIDSGPPGWLPTPDPVATGQPDAYVVPAGAELAVQIAAGVVVELLEAFVPAVGQRQRQVAVGAGEVAGGDDHRDDLQAEGERAGVGVLLPPVDIAIGHRTLLGQVRRGAPDRGVCTGWPRSRELGQLAGQ